MKLRRRQETRKHKLYEQWTGCPHICECGRTCGWRPGADPVANPEQLRFGMTNGMASRIRTYQRDGQDYFDHVGVIGMRHLPLGTDRDKTLDIEAQFIDFHRQPFNDQHNPDFDSAELERERLRILGEPIAWHNQTDWFVERATHRVRQLMLWLLISSIGATGIYVGVSALQV